MSLGFVLIAGFVLYFNLRYINGDICKLEKTCTETCYRISRYTGSCGVYGLGRCNKYRSVSYSCTVPCEEDVCCTGYTGEGCNTPICFNSTTCANGGTCVSPDNCSCIQGYSEPACDDIDECGSDQHMCKHICVNTIGTYKCACNAGYMLQTDLLSCSGDVPNIDVFERLRIPRKLLPVGCFSFVVSNTQILISTLPWFCQNKDPSICYTSGIVHIDIKTRLHPVSIQGVKITNKNLKSILMNGYKESQGSVIEQEGECKEIELSPIDIQQFIKEGSFIRSFFTLLRGSFPSWLSLSPVQPHTLSMPDMKSEVKTGGQISDIEWCSKAPVMHDRMYLIFRFTTAFKLEIYNKSVFLPEATNGERFCVVADISQYSNGTVFILIPKRVSETVGPLTEYLKTSQNVRGLGVSLDAAIKVDYSSLEFWNGYNKFTP